ASTSTAPVAAVADLAGRVQAGRPEDFILDDGDGLPPALEILQEGGLSTFVLGAAATRLPSRISTGLRILHCERLTVAAAYVLLRTYMLHLPCRTLVRDCFVADGVWPDALPQIDFYLPGPTGSPPVELEPGKPHLRRLNLTARIEQLPRGAAALELAGVADQRPTLERAMARAGLQIDGFRGWRCRMAYPVPLVEMQLAFRFAGR
ncbi:MAG: hypothetical protein WAQ05_02440, partial [Rubrivivax sp.]